ncbi:TIGR02996 domain-containing protein [Fimbriiglobus ruber]|nr:TIGR02996 domain-containing protein [Fimbriiglobus ruber]
MSEEAVFLRAITAAPDDDLPRLVFADRLDERDDPRGDFVRLHLALRAAAPDHPDRVAGEHELSSLRKSCDPEWLAALSGRRARII